MVDASDEPGSHVTLSWQVILFKYMVEGMNDGLFYLQFISMVAMLY
jgi:hypothetical protein